MKLLKSKSKQTRSCLVKEKKQRSILSYFSVKNRNSINSNFDDTASLEDPTIGDRTGDSRETEITTPKNLESVDACVSTPTFGRKELCDSAYNDLLGGLSNSSDESMVGQTPQRKRSFRLGQGNRKRLRLTQYEEESVCPDEHLSKRIKLSQSPKKSTPEKENNFGSCSDSEKCESPSSRNVLQEIMTSNSQSMVDSKVATKKHSTDDFVDIENLGDFLNEDWCEEFEEKEYLHLNEWKTCLVTKVEEVDNGLMVELQEYRRKINKPLTTSCFIQGYWGDQKLKCKDIVNIKAYYDSVMEVWRVDHTQGFIVKHPDILISGTALSGSLFCQRRAVLNYLYPGLDCTNSSMLIGTMVHVLLQEVLTQRSYSEQEIKATAVKIMNKPRHISLSYESGLSSTDLDREILSFVPRIIEFINTYVLEIEENKEWPGKVKDIVSTEENFWIPQLGLKGKADFIVEAESDGQTRLMPLELKTGRASNAIEHRAQMILYLMMMSEVGMDADSGLLLYLKHNTVKELFARTAEMQGLVTTRNNLVDYYAANETFSLSSGDELFIPTLPAPINHHSGCSRCPYLTVCSAHLEREPNVNLEDSNPLKTLSSSALSHLSAEHIRYVFRWTSLLKLEDMSRKKDMVAKISDIWFMTTEDREKRGYCLSQLMVENVEKVGNAFVHQMRRSQNAAFDLTKSSFAKNDRVVISTNSRIAITSGYIHAVYADCIYVKFDRILNSMSTKNEMYIIDTYSWYDSLLGFNTSSLFKMFDEGDTAARMRRLIIDMELPSFRSMKEMDYIEDSPELSKLNRNQKLAVMKTLAADDYLLIKGLPGTGKTSTLVALVRLLVRLKYSVLVTSHTHSAVDNILLRLKEHVSFLRLGSSSKVHKELQSYCEDFRIENENIHTVEQLQLLYNQESVIAVTCMGCSHALLDKRRFDYCIVDEATQVLQPSVLKSLFSARKFVLVGDPNQLPPVVQSKIARESGFDESLFVKLDRTEVTNTLHFQYRMNSEIMNLANSFAYDNQLQCDQEDVRSATIEINYPPKAIVSWLDPVLSSRVNHSIIFLNTSKLSTSQASSEYTNPIEAKITFKIIEALIQDIEDIGVIAPYRDQVKLLKHMADTRQYDDIEINTVDQYQGRDKDVIIYCCTKHSNYKEGGILADKRRLTVAITRAKRKLIIIGNIPVLKKYAVFEELINLFPRNNIIDVLLI